MISQLISGLVIAFTSSWKLTLVMLCVAPFIIITVLVLVTVLKKGIILSRKTYEKAGGIAEEVLYNIKTVASFANFEYETKRFNSYVDKVEVLDADTGMKLAACLGVMIVFIYCTWNYIACQLCGFDESDAVFPYQQYTAGYHSVVHSNAASLRSIFDPWIYRPHTDRSG